MKLSTGARGALLAPAILLNVLALIIPAGFFLTSAFRENAGFGQLGGFSMDALVTTVTDPFMLGLFGNYLVTLLIITLGCTVIGFPVCYVIARSRRWGGFVLNTIMAVSFVSAIVMTIGWLTLLGANGPIASLLSMVGVQEVPPLLNSPFAVVIALIHVELHFMVLACLPSVMQVSRNLEDAAMGLGASWWQTMMRVVLPMSLPGVLAGGLLVMATTAGAFTTPAVLGGQRVPWVPVFIERQANVAFNYPMAATASLFLVLLVVGLTMVANRFASRRKRRAKRSPDTSVV